MFISQLNLFLYRFMFKQIFNFFKFPFAYEFNKICFAVRGYLCLLYFGQKELIITFKYSQIVFNTFLHQNFWKQYVILKPFNFNYVLIQIYYFSFQFHSICDSSVMVHPCVYFNSFELCPLVHVIGACDNSFHFYNAKRNSSKVSIQFKK